MRKSWASVLFICFFVCCSLIGASAQSDINFTSLTVKEGLSCNTVYAILKDRYGMMWFGTANGLNRFDGTNFSVYRHEMSGAKTIPSNEVLSLFEDRGGKLWIGTGAGGLSYYDRAMDRVIPYTCDGSWPELSHVSPRAILQDHEGKLWVGTYGDLRTIDTQTGHATRISMPVPGKSNDESFVVLYLFGDRKHQIWIGTNNGLFLYSGRSFPIRRFVNDPADASSLSNNVIKAIAEDKHGDLWFATLGGLNQLKSEGHFKVYQHRNDSGNSISSDAVFSIRPDSDGKIWVATEDGLNILNPATDSFQILRPDPRVVFSLKSKSIRSLFIDPSGIYWVGTFGGGLAKYNKNLALFNLKQSNPFDPSGLKSPIVTSFAEANNGLVFVGTDGAGIQVFNRKTGLFSAFVITSRLHQALSGITIMKLFIDHDGFLWAGTYREGLFRIDTRTGQYEQFTTGPGGKNLSSDNVTSMAEDGLGNLWVGTVGGGVNIFNFKAGSFIQLNNQPVSGRFKNKLPLNDFIGSIARSPTGDLWIASSGTGVAVFNPLTGNMTHYTKEKNGLPDNVVDNLFFDRSGLLWLSTGGGLCSFDTRSKKVTNYTEKDGLENGMVKGITEDQAGMIWVSTDRGISSFNKNTRKFRNFNAENGIQQGSFLTGAIMRASNGDIFVGGRDGFNYFNPSTLPQNYSHGPVMLTDLKISNESVIPGEKEAIHEQIAIAKEIKLHYGLNFSISYVALNYTTPKQNQFAYKLVGFDKEWNYVHGSRIANYTNIDPGTYTFQVKASNDGEHWSLPPTEIKIVVLPPFWRTYYAYMAYIIFAVLTFAALRRRGIQKIRKEFEIQQEKIHVKQLMEQERREAEQLHELDGLKIKFLTDLSHEFRTPISLILAPVEKLLERKLIPEAQSDIKMINRNVRRLLNMVNQLLDFRKMEEEELNLHLVSGDIIAFIKETSEAFQDVASGKQIAFSIESKYTCWQTCFDGNKLERIIFNLLSNAFKFTPSGGKVILTIDINDALECEPHLIMTVTDTGVGIPQEALTRIFDRFYQHQTSAVLNQGTGIGLAIAKEFVELHGGHIHAETHSGGGARFVVDLPVFPSQKMNDSDEVKYFNEDVAEKEVLMPETDNQSIVACEEPEVEMQAKDGKVTVLLVEDNDEFRSYLAEHLQQYYHIVEAGNGKEGWQKTLSTHPQVVVSDINMPVMTGIELSKKIKEDKRTSHIPVILLTAMTGEEDQLAGLKSGASDYLSKPFNFQILNAKIGNLLDLNRNLKDTYSRQIQMVGHEIITESGNLKLLNSIMNYIEAKLSDSDLSVEDLSKHVGMSRGSLYYKLIELTGLSPIEYIRMVKLEKAAGLLENSELNVTQIAYMTGFGTPSYFSRMFKNKYGMVPSEYLNFKRGAPKGATATVA